MKKFYFAFVATVFALVFTIQASAQSQQDLKKERINTGYLLAIGRKPTPAEEKYWMGREDMTVSQYVENHRQYLAGAAGEKEKMITKSFFSAYGRMPTRAEIATNMQQNKTYTEWMSNHLSWLAKSPASFQEVISNAYKNVCGRTPTANDLASWKNSSVLSYMLVAATVEKWYKENGNQPRTAGSNTLNSSSSFLSTYNVSAAVAKEANGVVAAGGGNVVASGGGNVVAAGGGNVVASGGGNVVAAGGGN